MLRNSFQIHLSCTFILLFGLSITYSNPSNNSITGEVAETFLNRIMLMPPSAARVDSIRQLIKFFGNQNDNRQSRNSTLDLLRNLAIKNHDNYYLSFYFFDRALNRSNIKGVTGMMLLDTAIAKAQQIGYTKLYIEAISLKGSYFTSIGNYYEGLNLALESLRLSENNGFLQFLPYRYIDLLIIYKILGDTVRADEMALKSYNSAMALDNLEARASGAGALSDVFKRKMQFSKCIELLKLQQKWFSQINKWWEVEISRVSLADIYLQIGQLDSAKAYALKSVEIFSKYNNRAMKRDSRAVLANIYYKLGQIDSAIYYLKDCIQLNIDEQKSLANANLYKTLSSCYLKNKDYKNACETLLAMSRLRDSTITIERNNAAEEMSVKYETDKKIKEMKLLAQENKIQQAAVLQQQFIQKTIVMAVIISVVFSFLLFNRFKLKKKIEKQKAIIDERQRISRELHDDLGAQLSTAKMFLHSIKGNPELSTSNTALENSLSLIDSTIKDLRGIMDDLQTNVLQDKGYIAATEELVSKINQLQQINFTLTHFNADKRLDSKTEHNLFRITQELINNSLKYARAKNVSINLLKREGKLVLMYEDDGTGFNVSDVKKGNGLLNIESRCLAVGGVVEFDTKPGEGFRCNIELAVA